MVSAPGAGCGLERGAGKTGTDCIRSSVVDHNLDTVAGPGRLAGRQEVKISPGGTSSETVRRQE